jgi:hypothetical protein
MLFTLLLASLGLLPGLSLAQDDPCEVIYVQAGVNGGPPTTLWTTTSSSGSMPSEPPVASNSTPSTGAGSMNTTSNDTAIAGVQLAISGNLLRATQPKVPTPSGAAIYTPDGTVFDVARFNNWTHATYFDQKNKYMKIAPGSYTYLSASDQFNKGMVFWLYDGATLDLQGCT